MAISIEHSTITDAMKSRLVRLIASSDQQERRRQE